jgi:hypothetical protein
MLPDFSLSLTPRFSEVDFRTDLISVNRFNGFRDLPRPAHRA